MRKSKFNVKFVPIYKFHFSKFTQNYVTYEVTVKNFPGLKNNFLKFHAFSNSNASKMASTKASNVKFVPIFKFYYPSSKVNASLVHPYK